MNAKLTTYFTDGTDITETLILEMTYPEFWLIPEGLQPGDYAGEWPINGTTTKTYAGESRTVNYVTIEETYEDYDAVTETYWDRETGILLEYSTSIITPDGTSTEKYIIKDTNIWDTTHTPTPTQTPTPTLTPTPEPVVLTPLQATSELSKNNAMQGEYVTVSAQIMDDDYYPVEGATVTVEVEGETLYLTEQTGGSYEGTIDTTYLAEGSHTIYITAEKEGYQPVQTSDTLTVKAMMDFTWVLYIGIIAIAVIVPSVLIVVWKTTSKTTSPPPEITPQTTYPLQPPRIQPTPQVRPSRQRYCVICGAELRPNSRFCGECGTKIE